MTNIILTIALTLFMEAAGEGFEGQYAVASVIHTRANGNVAKYEQVCLKRKQFSSWNDKERNTVQINNIVPPDALSQEAWHSCTRIAEIMVANEFNPYFVADHFHTKKVSPAWRLKMKVVRVVGNHVFYLSNRKWL